MKGWGVWSEKVYIQCIVCLTFDILLMYTIPFIGLACKYNFTVPIIVSFSSGKLMFVVGCLFV